MTRDELTIALDQLANSLRSQFFSITSPSPSFSGSPDSSFVSSSLFSGQVDRIFENIGATARNYLPLSGGTLTGGVTVHGVSGLTAADIPTDITAANYLPLAGGIVSGDLSVTGNFIVAGAQTLSGAITVPYVVATSTTAVSIFQQFLANASTTLQNFTFANATGTAATTTSLYAGTAKFASLSLGSALGVSNGGTAITSPTATGILLGTYGGGGWQQLATSSLGLLTTNVAEGSNLYFTNARADARISATSSIGTLTSAPNLGTVATSLTGFLKATAGVLSTAFVNLASDVTGILPVGNGGTGWAAIAAGAVPFGHGGGALATSSNLFWDSTNSRLGIGTTSPSALLTLDSSAPSGTILRVSNGSTGGHIFDLLSTGSSNTGGAGRLDIFDYTADAARFSIASNGNVGIGSTSPAATLSVSGNGYFTGGLGVGVVTTQSGTINGWSPAWGVLSSNGGAPTTAGSGYAVGNTITLNAGCATNPIVSVASISGGGIADYIVQSTGSCVAIPANPVGQLSTSGTGSGATFTLRWGPIAAALDEPSLFSGAGNFFLGGTLGTSEAAGHAAYGFENTFVGDKAGSMATGGSANTALGHNAYGSGAGVAVTGSYNTAIGDDAMRNATSTSGATIVGQAANHDGGVFNDATAMGAGALYGNANASGSNITAIGYQAMGSSSVRSLSNETCVGNQCLTNDLSGSGNTALGHQAMQAATSSTNNTAVGAFALNKQTWGSANTAVGFFSMLNLTTGSNNVAAGEFALDTLTTGSSNTALGTNALNTTNGSGNVAVGNGAGQQSTGSENVFLGQSAGSGSGGSNRDTAIGNNALKTLTTGLGDIAIGWNTASTTTTGGQNIVIGYDIAPPLANGSNQLDIGNLIFGTGINGEGTNLSTGNIGIGTTSPDTLLSVGSATPVGNVAHFENSTGSCYINPTTTSLSCSSDARLKKNVVDIDASTTLGQLLALNPVLYNWNGEATGTPEHTGFIAQQVQPILPDLVSQGPDGYLTLNYAGFVPYLVKAVQEIATISGSFRDALVAWLADAGNGITDLFATTIHATNVDAGTIVANQSVTTPKLCLGSTCVTETQLQQLLQKESVAPAPAPKAPPPTAAASSSAPDSPTASSLPAVEDAIATTSPSGSDSDSTSSLPAIAPAPPLVPDYDNASTTAPVSPGPDAATSPTVEEATSTAQ